MSTKSSSPVSQVNAHEGKYHLLPIEVAGKAEGIRFTLAIQGLRLRCN